MDVIANAINHVMFEIDETILNDAFKSKKSFYGRRLQSIESRIEEEVIRKKVKQDLDNLGGVSIQIPLNGIPFEKLADYTRIYHIPKTKTMGRTISHVNRVSLYTASNFGTNAYGESYKLQRMSPVERSIQSVVTSHRPMPNMTNAEVEILSDNVVKINDYQNFATNMILECMIGFSDGLSEIKRVYYQDFAELVLWAVKAYIFRSLRLSLDKTRLEGGRDLGVYKEIVEEFRDANEAYRDLLNEKWSKILLLNDQSRKQKHILRSGKIRT